MINNYANKDNLKEGKLTPYVSTRNYSPDKDRNENLTEHLAGDTIHIRTQQLA